MWPGAGASSWAGALAGGPVAEAAGTAGAVAGALATKGGVAATGTGVGARVGSRSFSRRCWYGSWRYSRCGSFRTMTFTSSHLNYITTSLIASLFYCFRIWAIIPLENGVPWLVKCNMYGDFFSKKCTITNGSVPWLTWYRPPALIWVRKILTNQCTVKVMVPTNHLVAVVHFAWSFYKLSTLTQVNLIRYLYSAFMKFS